MVIVELIEEGGPQFLKAMLQSKTITVEYTNKEGDVHSVNYPAAAFRTVSNCIRYLGAVGYDKTIDIGQIIQQNPNNCDMLRGTPAQLLDHFAIWLYTGNISLEDLRVWDLWNFARLLGAPRYQNDIIKALCKKAQESQNTVEDTIGPSSVILGFDFDPGHLGDCWSRTNFLYDTPFHRCTLKRGSVYWGNKPLLKLMLDVAVYVGMKNPNITRMVRKGGYLAEHFTKLAIQAASSEDNGAPWAAEKVSKYLLKVPKMRWSFSLDGVPRVEQDFEDEDEDDDDDDEEDGLDEDEEEDGQDEEEEEDSIMTSDSEPNDDPMSE